MYASSSILSPLIYGCIDPSGFTPASFTVIEGSSGLVSETLFGLCAYTACSGHDVLIVDGANSFNPYAVSKAVKRMGSEPRYMLSRIHVARAFTEYQMDAIISDVHEAAIRWNTSLIAVLYLSYLFSTKDGKRLFSYILNILKETTRSLCTTTAVTSFGGTWWGDRMLAQNADKVIRIQVNKKHVRVQDGSNVFEHVPVPPGQTRFSDFSCEIPVPIKPQSGGDRTQEAQYASSGCAVQPGGQHNNMLDKRK